MNSVVKERILGDLRLSATTVVSLLCKNQTFVTICELCRGKKKKKNQRERIFEDFRLVGHTSLLIKTHSCVSGVKFCGPCLGEKKKKEKIFEDFRFSGAIAASCLILE